MKKIITFLKKYKILIIITIFLITSLFISTIKRGEYFFIFLFIFLNILIPIYISFYFINNYFPTNSLKENGRIYGLMITVSSIILVPVINIIRYVDGSHDKITLVFAVIVPILSFLFFLLSNFSKKIFHFKLGLLFLLIFVGSLLTILFLALFL